ncbi:HutD/Ves family protein [Leekyejoonella antrihumi]|uniref:HutD/Ves family protein n=1 Tax=Leekyejoonella antrihumi TaxID=1660198 RepID=UPI0016447EEF|nr:HutD family protein [Leekyejoonella antrihumi]
MRDPVKSAPHQPSRHTVLRWADAQAAPWKNGGGLTSTLLTGPAGSPSDAFDWRISIAGIRRSGDFSAFDGVERVFTLVEGDPVALTIDGTEQAVPLLAPLTFSGASDVSCALMSGPARALNVMTREGRCRAEVSVLLIDGRRQLTCTRGRENLLLPLPSEVGVTTSGGCTQSLGRFDLLRVHGDWALLEPRGAQSMLLIEIAPIG